MRKHYIKPETDVVKLQQPQQILAGSNYGVNDNLQGETVEEGW